MTVSKAQRAPRPTSITNDNNSLMTSSLIAPVGQAFKGHTKPLPWQYQVTVIIPHLNTPECLEVCVKLLDLQSTKPYILIIDTGSSEENISRIEQLRAKNVEIHYLKSHGWRHPSEPVAVAQDLGLLLCRTQYMYCTHADCLVMRRDLLEDWVEKLAPNRVNGNEKVSVIGYQISPRPYQGWEKEFGHTALMFYVPDIKRHKVNWNMEAYCQSKGRELLVGIGPNDPDTESNFNLTLQASGLKSLMVGTEQNYVRNLNTDFDHPRSYASSKIYNEVHFKKMEPEMLIAISDGIDRIKTWSL